MRLFAPAVFVVLATSAGAHAQGTDQAPAPIIVTGTIYTQAECAALGRGEDPSTALPADASEARISAEDCTALNRVERLCMERFSTRRNGMYEKLHRSAGGRAARRWGARMLVGCLEQGAAENELEVTFSGIEEYAEEYVERIFTGNGDEDAVPR